MACDNSVELVRMIGARGFQRRPLHPWLEPTYARYARHRDLFPPGQRRVQDAGRARSPPAAVRRRRADHLPGLRRSRKRRARLRRAIRQPAVLQRTAICPGPRLAAHIVPSRRSVPISCTSRPRRRSGGVCCGTARKQSIRRLQLSHQFRPVQRALRRRLGQGPDLAIPPLVS